MLEILERIGSGGVQAFWMPVLVWTVLAGVAVLALGVLERRLHPLAGYRLRQAVLLALPVSVAAAPWAPVSWVTVAGPLRSWSPGALDSTMPPPLETVPLGADAGTPVSVTMALLGLATVAVALLAVVRLAMLVADIRRLRGLRRAAPRVADPGPTRMLGTLAEQLGVGRPVELLEGPPDSVPMTFGARRPVVVVPRSLLDSPESLGTVLAHELVHVRRVDYLWALADCLTSAAFAFHPLVGLLRRGIERCRETSCDAEVLAAGIVRPGEYAELLARTHTPTQFPTPAVAASMSARSLTLKERLETMEKFADRNVSFRQRVGIVLGAGFVCLVVAVAGACATRTDEEERGLLEPSGGLEALSGLVLSEPDRAQQERQVVYNMTRGTGPSRYGFRATEEQVLEALELLDLEMQYLREQMDATKDAIGELDRARTEFRAKGPQHAQANRAEERALLIGLQDEQTRHELLKSMRDERMRDAETMKLQYTTQKRMRESR